MVTVWFNHWFSTSYNIIELLKNDSETKFHVIGTNQIKFSVIQNVCDEWYEEPVLEGEDYINYCLEFCKLHNIDLFIPRLKMIDISNQIQRFIDIGVKVMVDDFKYISILNDKAKTYELLKSCKSIHIPDYFVVKTIEQLVQAYDTLSVMHEKICVKFVYDEGGKSFRIIDNSVNLFDALCDYPSVKISYHELVCALSEKQEFNEMIIMPYLPGAEISVDCLVTDSGLVAVPRVKGYSRDELVEFDNEVIEMCKDVLLFMPLQYPCNIQFKILDGVKYLLEINTRMSGGVPMSCLSAGINIPNIAANKMIGKSIKWKLEKIEKRVSYMEIPKIINEISV